MGRPYSMALRKRVVASSPNAPAPWLFPVRGKLVANVQGRVVPASPDQNGGNTSIFVNVLSAASPTAPAQGESP